MQLYFGTMSSSQLICPSYAQGSAGTELTATTHSLRPFAVLDSNKIVFAADKTYGRGQWYDYKIIPGTLGSGDLSNAVKLRVSDSGYNAVLNGIHSLKDPTKKITKTAKNTMAHSDFLFSELL